MAYAATRTVPGTSDTPTTSDDGGLIQYTSASAKTITLTNSSWVAGRAAFAARISGGGTATFVAGSGVTVNGDTSISSGLTVVCQYTGSNTWEIVGTDVLPVASGGTGATTAAAARRNLQALGPVFDVTAYGAVGNGSTNDTAAFNSARDAAVAAGGGIVYVPAGTYVVAGHVMANRVHYMGAHWRSSRIKLPASSTSPIFTTNNFAALFAAQTANANTLGNFAISNLTFDGNKANAPSGGSGIEIYGVSYFVHDVVVRDCADVGFVSGWGPGGSGTLDPSPFNADPQDGDTTRITNLTCINNIGGNIDYQGPHDGVIHKVFGIYNASYADATPAFNMRCDGQAGGTHLTDCHIWGPAELTLDAQRSVQATGCQFEGASVGQVRFGVGVQNFSNCRLYSPAAGTEAGFIVDNSGDGVTNPSSITVTNCLTWDLPGGAVKLDNDGGNNRFEVTHFGTGPLLVGTPHATTQFNRFNAASLFINANTTLEVRHAGAYAEVNNASLVTITVPTHAAQPIPRGSVIWVHSMQGPVDITPASGVALNSADTSLTSAARRIQRRQSAILRKRNDSEWDLVIVGGSHGVGSPRFVTASTAMEFADAGGWVEFNSASPTTFTCIASASDTLPTGAVIRVANLNTGVVTIAAGSGGSLIGGGSPTLNQGQVATLIKRSVAGQFYCGVA